MTTAQIVTTIIVGVLALLGGASATAMVNAWANRKVTDAEADSLVVDAADRLMTRQQQQLDRGDKERVKMEAKIEALETEVAKLRVEIHEERARCDTELAQLRQELVELALHVNPKETP